MRRNTEKTPKKKNHAPSRKKNPTDARTPALPRRRKETKRSPCQSENGEKKRRAFDLQEGSARKKKKDESHPLPEEGTPPETTEKKKVYKSPEGSADEHPLTTKPGKRHYPPSTNPTLLPAGKKIRPGQGGPGLENQKKTRALQSKKEQVQLSPSKKNGVTPFGGAGKGRTHDIGKKKRRPDQKKKTPKLLAPRTGHKLGLGGGEKKSEAETEVP